MKDKLAKQLAEKHFFYGKKLSPAQKTLVENSKYANVLRKEQTSKFSSLFEQAVENTEENKPFKPRMVKRRRFTTPWVDKLVIKDLSDDIEEKYNLGINNPDPSKFSKVNLDELKQFIKTYAARNVFENNTQAEIDNILASDSVYTILHKLYSLQ